MILLNEDTVEQAALEWLGESGYGVRFGGDIAPGEPAAGNLPDDPIRRPPQGEYEKWDALE